VTIDFSKKTLCPAVSESKDVQTCLAGVFDLPHYVQQILTERRDELFYHSLTK
jgi:hypothetical protein